MEIISPTCVVTAYYAIKSKFSDNQYRTWITHFMATVQCDIVLYTTPDLVEYFENFKKQNLVIRAVPLDQIYFYKHHIDVFRRQWKRDPIQYKRSPELYCIWYNKCKFIEDAYTIYGNKYDQYIWCDIGCFRETEYLKERKQFGLLSRPIDKIPLLCLRSSQQKDTRLYTDSIYGYMKEDDVFIGGGILGIPTNLIETMISLIMSVFDKLTKSDRFYGCDQRLYAYMWAEKPDLFELMYPPVYYKKDPWFYLLDYYQPSPIHKITQVSEPMNILFCIDKTKCESLKEVIISIVKQTQSIQQICFYILTDTEETCDIVKQLLKPLPIDVTYSVLRSEETGFITKHTIYRINGDSQNRMAFSRFYAPDHFDIDTCLYLDADKTIEGDIIHIKHRCDVNTHPCWGIPIPRRTYEIPYINDMVSSSYSYFYSGMYYWNCREWKQSKRLDMWKKIMIEHAICITKPILPMEPQAIMNWLYLNTYGKITME